MWTRRELPMVVASMWSASATDANCNSQSRRASEPIVQAPLLIDALSGPGDDPDAQSRKPLSSRALDDIRDSGLNAVNLTVGGVGHYARDYGLSIENIAYWNSQIAAHPDRLLLVRRFADLLETKSSGRLGLIYGFQDSTPLADDTGRIELFERLGVRVFQMTYNRRNLLGDGCLEPANAGLSMLGHTFVEHLNARKLLIDLSHAGERTTRETIAASTSPVAITHTGCAALAPLPRNKTDAELRAVAEKGGVAGVYLMPFLRTEGQPTAADFVRHVEHAVNVCGEEHVGVGTDGGISPVAFDEEYRSRFAGLIAERQAAGIAAPGERSDAYPFIPDLNRSDRLQRIAALLAQHGHGSQRIDKILGGNFARLLRTVWADRE